MCPVKQTAIYAQQIITPQHLWDDGLVLIEDGTIRSVGNLPLEIPDTAQVHSGHCLIPGMIDLHINGAGGGDAADGTFEALEKMSLSQAAHGVTGFLPTIITNSEESLVRSLDALSGILEDDYSGARPLGIHMEGPFLSPEKRGAHRLECIQSPSVERLRTYLSAARGKLKMLTLAPEPEGALEVIGTARGELPIVSLGHSNADYETARRGFEAGANLATHLFNAMPSLHHREPGLIAAVFDDREVCAEIIADGIHVHPAMIRLMVRNLTPERVILVTDAISAADQPDGTYWAGNVKITVKDGVCRERDGRLAGSTLTMDTGLRNLYQWLRGIADGDLKQTVSMATLQPARLLGEAHKGSIEVGSDADLVLLDPDFNVQKTWVGGRLVYDRERRAGGTSV